MSTVQCSKYRWQSSGSNLLILQHLISSSTPERTSNASSFLLDLASRLKGFASSEA